MRTRIRKGNLYILEWMQDKGLTDDTLADRMGVSRVTVWRWHTEQHRLNPQKIANLARAIGDIEPEDLYRPPARRSIDAILKNAPDDVYEALVDHAQRLTRRTG